MDSAGMRASLMRGGTSKGLFFTADALPEDPTARDQLLLRIMGSPDPRQIDGVGGGHPLTSKVAVVTAAADDGVDLDYLFLQVSVDQPSVSARQTCGNLLAAVGPFAVERGIVPGRGDLAEVRIRLVNTGQLARARFPLSETGRPRYDGDAQISGVPGSAAPIWIGFEVAEGGQPLLPTGRSFEEVAGVPVTCVDAGMPVVVLRAADVGVTGYESCEQLEGDRSLRERLEALRLEAGRLMGFGDVRDTTVPKLTLLAAPQTGGTVATRTFIPHRCHAAIGVLGAVSVAAACRLPGSVAEQTVTPLQDDEVRIEHPSGTFTVTVAMREQQGGPTVGDCTVLRTARKLMDGVVFPRAS